MTTPLLTWTRHPHPAWPRWATYQLYLDGQVVLQVGRCGHPSALRPYYLRGPLATTEKFRTVAQAKAAAEKIILQTP